MQRSPLRELDCFGECRQVSSRLESFRGLRSPEHEARELMPVVDEDAFNSLESSALPSLGDQDSLLRSWPSGRRPRPLSHSWPPFFSHPSCAPSTLGRNLEVWRHGHLVPIVLWRSSSSWRGTSLGYVCNPSSLRERDAASLGHTSGIPASSCFIFWSWRRFHRTCFYASWPITSPACDVSPILWTDYTCDSEHGQAFP